MYEDFDAALNDLAGGKGNVRAIERFTPYVLRHNYATMMADAGVPPQYLKYLMGHSSVDVTMKYYVHVSERQQKSNEKKIKTWNLYALEKSVTEK